MNTDDSLKDLRADALPGSPALTDQGARVESFGELNPPPPPQPFFKPASATMCHLLALVGGVGGSVFLLIGLITFGDKPALIYVGFSGLLSAVFWWALGDITFAVSRISENRKAT